MSVYGCVSTGDMMGMIEVVPNSVTTAKIQKNAGGILGAFKQTPLKHWLAANNPNEGDFQDAIDTFTFSCAAYCVATYVIGIGDRHNDVCFRIMRNRTHQAEYHDDTPRQLVSH